LELAARGKKGCAKESKFSYEESKLSRRQKDCRQKNRGGKGANASEGRLTIRSHLSQRAFRESGKGICRWGTVLGRTSSKDVLLPGRKGTASRRKVPSSELPGLGRLYEG